jgi:hypothetical protein
VLDLLDHQTSKVRQYITDVRLVIFTPMLNEPPGPVSSRKKGQIQSSAVVDM